MSLFSNFSFKGRIGRFQFLVTLGLSIAVILFTLYFIFSLEMRGDIESMYGLSKSMFESIVFIVFIVPSIFVLETAVVKRLHDIGYSGVFFMIPFNLVLFINVVSFLHATNNAINKLSNQNILTDIIPFVDKFFILSCWILCIYLFTSKSNSNENEYGLPAVI